MSEPSFTAGKACAECGMPDPCLHKIEANFPKAKEHHIWPIESPVTFDLLDKGTGCEGTITIISKCQKIGCPESMLNNVDENTSTPLKSDSSPNPVILHYKNKDNDEDIIDILHSPWDYLSTITSPADLYDNPAHYIVKTKGCWETGNYIKIDVYPTIEMRFTVGLSYEIIPSIRERTTKERRDEQIKSRMAMDDTKPKNSNKLRAGWKYHTDQFELTRKTALTVDFGVKIADTEYSEKYAQSVKKIKTVKSLEQLKRVDTLVDNINKFFTPDPDNPGNTRGYSLFSMKIEPVKLGVSYAYQYIDTQQGPYHYMGLYGNPFLSGSFKFDIIQFICAYCKIETLVGKCRDYLKKRGASIDCYLQFLPGVNINIGAAYSKKENEWSFNILKGNQLKLGLEGVISAAFKMEVFWADIALNTSGKLATAAGFELDQHDDGLDLAGYHDGIKGYFEFVADFRAKRGDKEEQQAGEKIKKEWLLAAPLKASDSPLRINLYGKVRSVPQPTITVPVHAEPWAMGSNPNNNKKDDKPYGYNGIPQL